jgi:hypothetical protein
MKTIEVNEDMASLEGPYWSLARPAWEEAPTPAGDEKLEIPFDLSEWVDRCELLAWVEEEVGKLDWDNAELVAELRKDPEFRPRMLLTLLTYGHLTQVFSSDELEERCYRDPVFVSICEAKQPAARELGRFRRENRGLIKILIAPILLRAVCKRFGLGDGLLPAGLKKFVVDNAVERLDLARHMDCQSCPE